MYLINNQGVIIFGISGKIFLVTLDVQGREGGSIYVLYVDNRTCLDILRCGKQYFLDNVNALPIKVWDKWYMVRVMVTSFITFLVDFITISRRLGYIVCVVLMLSNHVLWGRILFSKSKILTPMSCIACRYVYLPIVSRGVSL